MLGLQLLLQFLSQSIHVVSYGGRVKVVGP